MDTLADSLALVLPEVPTDLVPPRDQRRISALAGSLAPIHCAGFEVRLAGKARPADFAQRILACDGEPTRLADHIEASGLARADPTWKNLLAFARDWARPASAISDEVAGAWLEFDTGSSDAEVITPSLFVSLRAPVERGEAPRLVKLLRALSALFGGAPGPEGLESTLGRAVDNCVDGVGVTDVGLMLARGLDAVRLAAAPFAAGHVGPFLERLDWPGGEADLAPAMAVARDDDEITVSFDIAAGYTAILPRLGVEYFPGPYLRDLPCWQAFLAALVDHDLCTPGNRQALLAWPGYTSPEPGSFAWPAALIAESMLRPACDFSVIGRRLNHVKLTCGPGKEVQAKAYFGFGPLWLQPDLSEEATETGSPTGGKPAASVRGPASRRSVEQGLPRAVAYLLTTQSPDGWWRDFATVMGGSDEWVTAYTASELAAIDDDDARRSAHAAWQWLLGRRGIDSGWGFNGELPEDADGTSWGLLLSDALGAADCPRSRAARAVLEEHSSSDGGVASYLAAAGGSLAEILGDVSMAGLFAPHVCVTAAATRVPGLEESTRRFLLRQQLADGRWLGYWWCDDEYATGLAALGLGRQADAAARAAATRAGAWAADRIRADGSIVSRYSGEQSAFATASGALALLGAEGSGSLAQEHSRALTRALHWLLGAQRPDGSWAPSAWMRIPPAGARSPSRDGSGAFVGIDSAGIFTTATAVRTLRLGRASLA